MNMFNPQAWYLGVLLVLLAVVFLIHWNKNNKIDQVLGKFTQHNKQEHHKQKTVLRLQFLFPFLALVFLLIAALDFRTLRNGSDIDNNTRDIVFALDVSNSMNAVDVEPSRLQKSILFLTKLINANQGNRMALVLFAGNAYISSPLTLDYSALHLNLSSVSSNTVPYQGSALGKALEVSRACLDPKQLSAKNIVLISDGETHDADALDQAKLCKDENIRVFTVGVGTEQGKEIVEPDTQEPKRDMNGNVVLSKLNEPLLRGIATASNGIYTYLKNPEFSALNINSAIASEEGVRNNNEMLNDYAFLFRYFSIAALCLLLLAYLFPYFSNSRKKSAVAAGLFFLLSSTTQAQTGNHLLRGNMHYRAEQYDSALTRYQQIAEQGKTIDEKATAFYNSGNAYLMKGDYNHAIEQYKKSLSLKPAEPKAQYNLAYAQKLKQNFEQQEQKNKEQNQKKEEQEDKSKQQKNKDQQKKENEAEQNKERQKSKPEQSKLNKQEAERLLDAIKQEEKKIQERRANDRNSRPMNEKDW